MSRRKRTLPPDIAHVLARLKLAIQALGLSMRDVERRLHLSDGYFSRVFMGIIELKINHILGIARALQMAPEELFAFIYPNPKEPISPAAYQLWTRMGGKPPIGPGMGVKQPPLPEPLLTEEQLERALRKALGSVLGSLGKEAGEGEKPPQSPQ